MISETKYSIQSFFIRLLELRLYRLQLTSQQTTLFHMIDKIQAEIALILVIIFFRIRPVL